MLGAGATPALPGCALQGGQHASFVAERAELALRQSGRYGLYTRAQCVEYLGSLFRVALDVPQRWSDFQVGGSLCG